MSTAQIATWSSFIVFTCQTVVSTGAAPPPGSPHESLPNKNYTDRLGFNVRARRSGLLQFAQGEVEALADALRVFAEIFGDHCRRPAVQPSKRGNIGRRVPTPRADRSVMPPMGSATALPFRGLGSGAETTEEVGS